MCCTWYERNFINEPPDHMTNNRMTSFICCTRIRLAQSILLNFDTCVSSAQKSYACMIGMYKHSYYLL